MWFGLFLGRALGRRCVRCGVATFAVWCDACQTLPAVSTLTRAGLVVSAVGRYSEAIGEEVRALKYQDVTYRAPVLGEAMRRSFPPEWKGATLVPVPLHPERLAERGYNQSALLARALAARGIGKMRTDVLRRRSQGKAQAKASREERLVGVQEAFVARPSAQGLTVVLVDDVVTTGSTLDACAHALQWVGAKVIGACCCAVAGSERDDSQEPMSQKMVKASPPSSRSAGR